MSSSGKEIYDLLDRVVCSVVRGFEFAVGLMMSVRPVMKAAVGEWATEPFVKE